MLPEAALEKIATLVGDRSLSVAERESQAAAIAGTPELARRALDWLPEAFGLVAVGHVDGLILPKTFQARRLDGTWQQFPFDAEPLFAQAVQLALALCHSGDRSLFGRIAERSSCVNAVDKAIAAGEDLHGGVVSGPALAGIPAETYSTDSLGNP